MQRTSVANRIDRAGVFNCRQTSGTSLWSPHARGDAGDLMLKVANRTQALVVFENAVAQATKRTVANRGRKTKAVHIIGGTKEWIRGEGVRPYSGVPHDNHVHVGFSFSSPVKPPCA